MSRPHMRWIGVALGILALALPVQAQNVLTIRVESLDALLADVDTVAVALGRDPGSARALVQRVADQLGLGSLDRIDGAKPLVVALPLQGMMLGDQGFVGAFPVADVEATIAAMKSGKQGVFVDENGLIHVPMGEAPELLLLPSKGYLLYGHNPNLIGGFDPTELLSGAHLPRGTIAAEFNADPLRAMIGMGMEGARQALAGVIAQGAEKGGRALDAETTAALANTIVGWAAALVDNTRSIQLSLQVSDKHLVVHNRYLPVEGSTLAALLQTQKGGMPEVARLLDGNGASMTMVANVNLTDEATAALAGFMQGYGALLQSVLSGNTEMGPLAGLMPTLMEQSTGMLKCMRGDLAQVMDTTADGLRYALVSGLRDTQECRTLDQTVGKILSAHPEALGETMTHSPGALAHRGVEAAKIRVNAGEMFGADGWESYLATTAGVWINAGGRDGDETMRTLIDRVKDSKRGRGIDAAVFEPFKVTAGVYFTIDPGKFFSGFEDDEFGRVFRRLGSLTSALEFRPDAMALEFAIETGGLSALADMARRATGKPADHHDGD